MCGYFKTTHCKNIATMLKFIWLFSLFCDIVLSYKTSAQKGAIHMRILEELYCGNINPDAKQFKHDSAYGKAMATASENEELLLRLPRDKEKRLLIDLVNAQSTICGEMSVEHFIMGFRLGAQMGFEVMREDVESCLRDIG